MTELPDFAKACHEWDAQVKELCGRIAELEAENARLAERLAYFEDAARINAEIANRPIPLQAAIEPSRDEAAERWKYSVAREENLPLAWVIDELFRRTRP